MPKMKGRKCVGQKKKNHRKLSAAKKNAKKKEVSVFGEHSYSKAFVETSKVETPIVNIQPSQQNEQQSTSSEADEHWSVAWENFFIEDGSGDDQQSSTCYEETDTDHFANEHYVVLHKIFQFSPTDDLDKLVQRLRQDRRYELFHSLRENLRKRENVIGGFRVFWCTDDIIQLVLPYVADEPCVKFGLNVTSALIPKLYVHKILLDHNHDFWTGLPKLITSLADLERIIARLESWDVCVGNHETDYVNSMPLWTTAHDTSNTVLAYREGDFGASRGDTSYKSTIRSTNCCMLSVKNRCRHCELYRRTLRKKVWRENKKTESSFCFKKNTPNKHMSKGMMISKIGVIRDSARSVKRELDMMRRKVFNIIGVEGQEMSDFDSLELTHLLKTHTSDFKKQFPDENSPQRLFWEQQLKCVDVAGKRGMRWHPMIVKWCLYMRSKSQKAYDAIRDAGFISLPSNRTLFDYSHCLPAECGFHLSAIDHLKSEADKLGMFSEDWKSYVGILQDEVKVSEGLVYDRASGELVGYIDLDKTGNDMVDLENKMKNSRPKLASSMLVIMVRGITSTLKYPIACFATNGITADLLYPCIWRAIKYLEQVCRLKVLFITCDGASPNRKFFKLHYAEHLQNTYWAWNRFAPLKRKIYFISDVPHLIKTTRNCFANSGSHKKSRDLWKNGQDIRWSHVVRLYEEYVEPSLYCHAHKLTRAHIDLTPFAKMKVNLAAQVLSKTVADALEHLYGDNVIETVNFIRHMNRFFDCLNTRDIREGNRKRNPDLNEYIDLNDPRLTFLTEEFLGYFTAWEQSVMRRQGALTKSQRAKMMLSCQTIQGLNITVRSIVECVRYLLSEGVDFVLTHRFNQDPLEEHFSHYRHKGGSNNNPTVYDVKNTMSQLRVIGSTALAPLRGNITNKRKQAIAVDNTPLMKRKK